MKPRAIATDVDGTLTDRKQRISCSAIRTIRMLEDRGIPVILVSGNALCVLKTLKKYIGCSGALVCEEGAVVEYEGTLRILGSMDEARRALTMLKERFGSKIVEHWSNPYRYVDVALERVIDKCDIAGALSTFPMLKLLDSRFAYHIIDRSLNKGKGLLVAAELMGIGVEEIIAVGDSSTDTKMLEMAGCGIALANAPRSLKVIADYVASKRNGEGFAGAIKALIP